MHRVLKGYVATAVVLSVLLGKVLEARGYPPAQGAGEIGIRERLGEFVPADISLHDETGKEVLLGSLIDKPTILSLTYYHCSNLCDNISAAVATLIGRLPSEAGGDYSVITVSFDGRDTPSDALQKRNDLVRKTGMTIPEKGWRFLTGSSVNITRLTDAVGFRSMRDGDEFRHPAALIMLSPQGKIIRYLYGTTYLPFDVRMALAEASAGRPGPSIPKALLFCYRYDPAGRRYVFDAIKVTGLMTLLFAGGYILYLIRSARRSDDGSAGRQR